MYGDKWDTVVLIPPDLEWSLQDHLGPQHTFLWSRTKGFNEVLSVPEVPRLCVVRFGSCHTPGGNYREVVPMGSFLGPI